MNLNLKPIAIGAAIVFAGYVGIGELADATLTTHEEQDPNSEMEIVVHGSIHEEAEHSMAVGVESLVRLCQLEVGRDIGTQTAEHLGDDQFRFVFQPALDEADKRQFKGCIGDIVIDHLQASVTSMEPISS